MMQSLTSKLPLEQRQRLHADFLANEQDYLRLRDDLLASHFGQWVAVQEGRVIASGNDLMAVMRAAADSGGYAFVARVGEEDTPFRVRRVEFTYDQAYQPLPIPRATVTFWDDAETHSLTQDDVIPDTGADVSVLPRSDCTVLDLFRSPCLPVVAHGVVGPGIGTLVYLGRAEIDGRRVDALIEPIDGGQERIVGRDVLNQYRVTFDGPAGRVIFGA